MRTVLRIIASLVVCLNLGACTMGTTVRGSRGVVIAPNPPVQILRQYIDVKIENICGDVAKIFNGDSIPVMTLGFAGQYTVRLQRPILASDRSLSIPISVQVFTKEGKFVGSARGSRYVNLRVDANNSGRTEEWIINRLENVRCPGPSAGRNE